MIVFLAVAAFWAQGGVPHVTRRFSTASIGPDCSLQVTLEVAFPADSENRPGVWLLEESWPPGWEISEATWNGQPLTALQLPGGAAWCWLFGEADTAPVGDGCLQYRLTAPEQLSERKAMNHADGMAYSFDSQAVIDGTEELFADESALPSQFAMRFPPGWSLLALPFAPDAASREALEALYGAPFTLGPGQDSCLREESLPGMGRPFWLYNPAPQEIEFTLAADVVAEPPEPLCPAGPLAPHGWNLFGVCGSDPVRLADGVAAYRWVKGRYVRCEENAVLQPGEAVWLKVE